MKKDNGEAQGYQPVLIALCCTWCAYPAADLAGTVKLSYPINVRIIRVMCSGMVHPNVVMDALTKGADGIIICGCHLTDCHYQTGAEIAERRAGAIKLMLEDMGLEPERFDFEHISASEARKFARVMTEKVARLKELGPSIYKDQSDFKKC